MFFYLKENFHVLLQTLLHLREICSVSLMRSQPVQRNKVIYPPQFSPEGWNDHRRRRSRKIFTALGHVPGSFRPLLALVLLPRPFALSSFLSRWLRRQPPPINLSARNLPTYCIYPPTKLLILQKEEGRQFVGPNDAYLTQRLRLWST